MEVKKVLLRSDNIKYIIIPRKSEIKAGDYVMIKVIDEKEVNLDGGRKEKNR